jgi:hypothetical protein
MMLTGQSGMMLTGQRGMYDVHFDVHCWHIPIDQLYIYIYIYIYIYSLYPWQTRSVGSV